MTKANASFTAVICLLLTSTVGARTYQGAEVIDMPFHIAGGHVMLLPVTDKGAIPAENDDIKIEGSGVSVGPSNDASKHAMLAWGFDFTVKSSVTPDHVVVEEVSPSDIARVLIDDRAPTLKNGTWSGNTTLVDATADSVPWMFEEKGSVFVFRFTISLVGKPPIVLYQPAWFSQPLKAALRQVIDKTNKKAIPPAENVPKT